MPWNPTRVLQRVGRVNRLGSEHNNIFVFNFFPTSQSDQYLGLENNITNKLQMFHYIMGEDARYLSDGEDIGSQELFNTLNKKATYTGEEEGENTELRYLSLIREIRDKNPQLFEKIKSLPKQARSGKKTESETNQFITFFRFGKLKKFYLYKDQISKEINFFEAMNLMECATDTKRLSVPLNYFDLLNTNKAKFRQDTLENDDMPSKTGGRSNAVFIERILKDQYFNNYAKFKESDEEFINYVRMILASGIGSK